MLKAYQKAWRIVVEEKSKLDPNFKKVLDNINQYRQKFQYWLDLNAAIMKQM